ncbi:choice-of-anchor F family protein [Guyparkeria hydrothermalis]|uniref:choice-of-anchor F family protein n=1 Tax=Guyparkeria hydrothermalis TaxID=923 RepID=UPI0020220E61|nr:choice-of-anchor F family protein [Guyparkeria hydrothermalis]MCL7744093.1 choice-of-anchor F family protein [Guyparkeria hydrothermalis]
MKKVQSSQFRRNTLSVLVAIGCGVWGSQAIAGEVLNLDYTAGDGFVFYDESDGLHEPGLKIITEQTNNDDANGTTPRTALNCILSNRDGVVCDSPPRSSKRVKNHLTGVGAFDTVYTTASTGGTTEYFNYGKITNDTGARLTGFRVIVGTGTGENFVAADDSSLAGLLSLDGYDGDQQDPRAQVPCGLFGSNCAQTGEVGYFEMQDGVDDGNDEFSFVLNGTDTLVASGITDDYLAIVGDGLLSSNQVPDGLFLDDGDPDTEDELLYWYTGNEWRDGNNQPVDQATVDAAKAQSNTYVSEIEDMANANLNYSFDIADVNGFTVRFVPVFSPIVTAAASDYQFGVAAGLDSSAISFLDADPEYATIIGDVLALPTAAEQQQALERIGTSYLRNYGTQGFLIGRDQFDQVLSHLSRGRMTATTASGQMNASATSVEDISAVRLASSDSSPQALAGLMAGTGSDGTMALTDRFSVFFGGSISQGEMDSTTNGAGADYDGYSLTGGADYRFFENTRLGAAIGYGENDASVVDNRGDLTVDGTTAMLYGSYGEATGPFVDAAAGYSWLDYENDRYIVVGDSINERAQSDTDGTQKSFTLGGGYNFELGRVIAGPSARFEYHNLDIDGYEETGAGVLSMSVEDMEFKSRTMWFGGQVAMPMELDNGGSIRPHASLHLVKELENGGSSVQTNFTGGTLPFSTPIDGRDDSYYRAGLGLDANFTSFGQPMTVSLNYDGTLGNDDYDEHRGSVSVSMYF